MYGFGDAAARNCKQPEHVLRVNTSSDLQFANCYAQNLCGPCYMQGREYGSVHIRCM